MRFSAYLLIGLLNGFSGASLGYAAFDNPYIAFFIGYCIFSLWWIAGNIASEVQRLK